MTFLVCLVTVFPLGMPEVLVNRPAPKLLTGRNLQTALKQVVEVRWQKADLRYIVNQISTQLKVGIVLDRRIDPSPKPSISLKNITLKKGLETIAGKVNARALAVGNTMFFIPAPKLDSLKSQLLKREAEWIRMRKTIPIRRRFELELSKTLHWNDLDEPRKIVLGIAKRYRVSISGAKKIPHDLWASATMPRATLRQQLTTVLFQYDLEFQWSKRGDSIEIVPITKMK
jgi:hypothetical protein